MTREADAHRATQTVARWYDEKTEDILRKYGPGPRVHYHTGVVDDAQLRAGSLENLRAALLAGQERLLEVAAEAWQVPTHWNADVLDVGCGLGGGSLFWAQTGARVVALTNVATHARLIEGFARTAGVADRVTVLVGDASTAPQGRTFDAIIAIESSCYFPRARWMRHAAGMLRPDGCLFISDIFAKREREARQVFDCDWLMTIGTLEEYERHATAAGLELCSVHDLTDVTRAYWVLSQAYHRQIRDRYPEFATKASRTIVRHERVLSAWDSGAIGCELVAFRRAR